MAKNGSSTEQIPEIQELTAQKPSLSVPVRFQLRWNLIALLVILTVLPVLFVLGTAFYQAYTQTGNQIKNQLVSVANLKRNEIIRWLDDTGSTLASILINENRRKQITAFIQVSFQDEFLESDRPTQLLVNSMLSEEVRSQSLFQELFVYNVNGRVIAASNPVQIGKVVNRQPYFSNSLRAENYIQPPYYEVGTGELIMITTHPILDESGQVIGALAGRLNLDIVRKIMTERTGLGETGETYLVSAESRYLLTPSRFPEDFPLLQAYRSEGIDTVLQGENGSGEYNNHYTSKTPVFGAFLWVPELQAGLVAEIEQNEALEPFIPTLLASLGIAGISIIVAILLGFYAATRISRPITQLTQAATQIAAGDLTQRAQIRQRNEIGLLATVFNQMTGQLQGLIGSLEERVADRTRRLEIVATMGESLNAILDFDQLLNEVVNQVKGRFDYYHAHIYIIDAPRQNLIVAAGAGEAGRQMKAQGHRIALNAPTSLVARAARTGEIVKVDNVREAPDWLSNPLLPDTYSEMAVPIILEGQVVGVLDVQESKIAGLDESDANLLRSLANQVAVAIRNARLFSQVEKALAEAHAAQEQYLEQAWDSSQITRRNQGQIQFSQDETVLNEEMITAARQKALAAEGVTLVDLNGSDSSVEMVMNGAEEPLDNQLEQNYALVAPIKLRDVTIGNLQLHNVEPGRHWSTDELALINAVIDQVAQAAETIRLIDETRERASRERLIGQVSDRLRRAPDLETLMKIGVEELSRILKPAHTFIRFGSETELLAIASDTSRHQGQNGPSSTPGLAKKDTENGQGDPSL